MSLFRKWGFGAELIFDSGDAVAKMTQARRAVTALKSSWNSLRDAGGRITSSITTISAMLAPLAAGFGFAGFQASSLAGNLEGQKLTMRVLIGDLGQANKLLGMIRENAASTPFTEGDLIEGSKRLLRLTGSNIDRNMDLLKTMETMAALNPGKTVVDAVEGLLDATSGGGFERLKEFGLSFRAEDFAAAGRPGGKAWADAVTKAIQAEMLKKTRGEDLVGALAGTFLGGVSTLRDSIENLLKGIGEPLNEAIKPGIVAATQLINDSAPDIVAGFRRAFDMLQGMWTSVGQPVLDAILGAWEALGPRGRSSLAMAVAMAGVLLTVLLPVGGALGAVVVFVGALATGLSAIFPLLSAVGSFLGAVFTPAGLIAVAAAGLLAVIFVQLATAAGMVLGTLALLTSRSNSLGVLWQALSDFMDGARARFDQLRVAGSAFLDGFLAAVQPLINTMLTELQPAFDDLVLAIAGLLQEMGFLTTSTSDMQRMGEQAGKTFGENLADGIQALTGAMRVVLGVGRAVVLMFTDAVRFGRRLGVVLFGISDGSLSTSSAMELMALSARQSLLTLLQVVAGFMLGTLQRVLAGIATVVAGVPGLSRLFGGTAGTLAANIGDLSQNLENEIGGELDRVDARAREIEQARAERSDANVTVNTGETKVEAQIDTKVCVDDEEIARANGAAAVRAGERGTGPALPARQSGRVLRNGVTVTPLQPAEAF